MQIIKILFLGCLLLLIRTAGSCQANLLAGWEGNGDTNPATSFPDRYGWEVSPGTFNYANSTSGIRYADVTSGHTLNGSNYTGRLLMVRWDGAGSTTLNSVYSYPVALEANKKYRFSWIYEWWNNGSVPTYTVKISRNKAGTDVIASKEFVAGARNELLPGDMSFYVASAQTYYVTIQVNNLAVLGGIGELRLVEIPPALESNVASVQLNYYEPETSIAISPNGSADGITLTAPAGIGLSAATLPATGGTVVVSSTTTGNVSGNIRVQQGSDVLEIPVTASFPEDFLQLSNIDTLNRDGAWCWFNDPRAIYHKGQKEQTYFSWVNSVGDIWISAYNHETGEYKEHRLHERLEVDDHDNPAILIRNDGRIIVYYSKHTVGPVYQYISTNPEDITSWGPVLNYGTNVTYPYPFQVGEQIYVFYRGINWHPTLVVSDDNGATVGTPQQFITGGGGRPYTRYAQDATGAIHIAVTTGHPRNEPNNKIYYARFKDGKFYRADGTFIKDYTGSATALNLDTEAEVVYNASNGKGWIWDITVDADNNPVMVYASFPTGTDHRYHYARWTGTQWFRKQLTDAGKWFPQTRPGASEQEPNYSGGISLDYDNPSVVYLSKPVKGVFEIFKFTTPDQGVSWDSTALTWNTPAHLLNVRPIVPRHHKEGYFDVLWMRGTYVHYTNYNTSIVYQMGETVTTVDRIEITPGETELTQGLSKQLSVTFYPFITSSKSLTWTSSDESVARVVNGLVTAVGTGTVTITATAQNGVTAETSIRVVPPVYEGNTYFDFGTSDSPVTGGALKMHNAIMLENSFGWQAPVLSRDRGNAASDELRDFNMASASTDFMVFVQPGTYHITARQGDLSFPHDNMSIYVNGEQKVSGVSAAAGSYVTSEFDVNVTGNYLRFTFADEGGSDVNWVINSLKIERTVTSTEKDLATVPDYQIYPNPVKRADGLYFAASGTLNEVVELYIYSIAGKLHKQLSLNPVRQSKLDISDLAPGFYVTKVVSSKGSVNKTLVVQ
ncbi:BNR-4 repeat-containing protein [Botryobacter ruber]|uniref:BNR-4 repeat-containing protein n=1 Tax=Botryobacter ruber TaxID=2171629 RepID=UPI000E0A3275|nr:BNR-4 repeat-containing protein [Botryobacter ruber]